MEKQRIYLVLFKTQYRLAATFMRFQEHYESPKFRDKVFSAEEYMDWYAEENGKFSYFEDWPGFNIPSKVLQPFYDGWFDPLTRKEKALLDLFKKMRGRFYVIGAAEWSKDFAELLRHEFVHGLFYTAARYRRDVRDCLQSRDISDFDKALVDMKTGYHPSVFLDEINAYVLTTPDGLAGVADKRVKELKAVLREVFFGNFGYYLDEQGNEFIFSRITTLHL